MTDLANKYRSMFTYCESSPTFIRWAVDRFSGRYGAIVEALAGDVAGGSTSSSGYGQVRVDRRLTLIHHIVWLLHNESILDGHIVDHIDGDKSNNRIDNLRCIPSKYNSQNAKKRLDNTSGKTGVTLITNKSRSGKNVQYWRAAWMEGGKLKNKNFSVKKYGYNLAKEMACDYRDEVVYKLNSNGAMYTDRHGK